MSSRERIVRRPDPDASLKKQRRVVDAFLAAVRDGDFEALVAVLDPEIVLRADGGALKGADQGKARTFCIEAGSHATALG